MPERGWLIPLAFAAVYLIWGSTYLAIRFAVETLPPFLMAGVRFTIAGALLYGWARMRGEKRPSGVNWRATAILGALLLVGGNGLVSWAELRVASGPAALLISTVPLFVVLLEWLGPRAIRVGPPSRLVTLGVVAGLVGIALLIGPGDLLGEGIDLIGAAALIVASLSWSFGSAISRRLPQPASPILGTAMQMLTGGGLMLVVGAALGEASRFEPAQASAGSLWALAYLIVFGSLIAFTAYVYLLRNVAITKVSTYAYVNPVVALLLGWALAGEELSLRTLLASAVILAAVVLITTHRRLPGARPPRAKGEPLTGPVTESATPPRNETRRATADC